MEEDLANLNIIDEEEEAFIEEVLVVEMSYQLCLVGRCLTDSVVHFPSMRNTMADLWHPIGGICDEDHLEVPLQFTEFWIQVHDLPAGVMTATMAKQFGDFVGQFLEYDSSIPTMGFHKFMCIRVKLDVSLPLKRKKKVRIGPEKILYARFLGGATSEHCDESVVKGGGWLWVWGGVFINHQSIVKESGHNLSFNGDANWRNLRSLAQDGIFNSSGPMDLIVVEENDSLTVMEGKKRQRLVGTSAIVTSNDEGDLNVLTASSAG
ncbi:hypothetical protein GOBAR_AA38636 [Gossypium barbadense]|uniref:Uncharacterized protein n=1 Tax=Gossypium barbadense TaxID=3634 RepID=A0A2P5VTA6_GOSBA|nr:hypothetical protein GOBAR_AA38636 [Gossypium barbadense]